jgi:5-methylcytosine-specific restriction endonuclease McrA
MHDFHPFYLRYIKSDAWKLKCEVYWAKNGRWCKACKTTRGPLMVHHMTYDHLGREPMADLMGLCQNCHREVHAAHRATGRRKDVRAVTMEFVRRGMK